jgi:glutamyl-tRNA reductase
VIDGLTVANLKKGYAPSSHGGEVFTLQTCQRTLVMGLGSSPLRCAGKSENINKIYHGKDAYQFLLETILGLQSEVVAEYEVVNQFKDAYQQYSKREDKNSHLLNVLEKLFKDQKKVRSEHLMQIGQMSYASIARKIIHSNHHSETVLILGSGALSHDLINLLKKKYKVIISARNLDKIAELSKAHEVTSIPWMDLEQYKKFAYIVNTIGTETVLLNENFFKNWLTEDNVSSNASPAKVFIDLGSPSAIETTLTKNDGVYKLDDIFNESVKLSREKMEKVESAKQAILKLTQERHQNFSMSIPFGWEELQFA